MLAQRRLLRRLLRPHKLLYSPVFSSSSSRHLFYISLNKIGSLDSTEKNGATRANYNGNALGAYNPPKAVHLNVKTLGVWMMFPQWWSDLQAWALLKALTIRFVRVAAVPVKETVPQEPSTPVSLWTSCARANYLATSTWSLKATPSTTLTYTLIVAVPRKLYQWLVPVTCATLSSTPWWNAPVTAGMPTSCSLPMPPC